MNCKKPTTLQIALIMRLLRPSKPLTLANRLVLLDKCHLIHKAIESGVSRKGVRNMVAMVKASLK